MTTSRSGMIDAFYTPDWVADKLANSLPNDLRGPVLDPTVGAGALLSSVESRFGEHVSLRGIDIDSNVVRSLRARHPDWTVSCANLLSEKSRSSATAWRMSLEELSAVVLNPPFSYRGNGGDLVKYQDFQGRVAPSVRFLVDVLTRLRPTAGVYGILPDGALDADRHDRFWSAVRCEYSVTRLERFKTTSFRGARVSTSLVSVTPGPNLRASGLPASPPVAHPSGCRCVEVIRGRVAVHSIKGVAPIVPAPFLHTTHRRSGSWGEVASASLADDAPMVLVNRVGRWSSPTVLQVGRAVLSDCLIGLRPRSRGQLESLEASVNAAQPHFEAEFRGTGAQYITLAAVNRQLEWLGWLPYATRASKPVGECRCEASGTLSRPAEVTS